MPDEHLDNHEAYQTTHEEGKLLGGKEKKPDRRNLMMISFVDMERLTKNAPKVIDWQKRYKRSFTPYHYQSWGSCTISSQAEMMRVFARREQFGRDLFIPEDIINKRYFRLAGDPNWESGNYDRKYDEGLYELDALKDFRDNGFKHSSRQYKIDAFTEVQIDKEQIKAAIFGFRGVKICYAVTQTMYNSNAADVVRNDNSSVLGYHSMYAHGYSDVGSADKDGLWMTHTWNRPPQLFTWDYVLARATEAYTCVDAKDIRVQEMLSLKKLKSAVKEAVEAPASEA